MLIAFPIGLWIFSLICDLIYHAGAHNGFWKGVAFYTMLAGVAGALLAAVPGFIDYLSLRDARTKKIATIHMALNLILVALFVFNLGVRYSGAADSDTADHLGVRRRDLMCLVCGHSVVSGDIKSVPGHCSRYCCGASPMFALGSLVYR